MLAARPCFPCLLSAIGHRIICSCGSLHCALKCHRTCPGEICTSSWSQAVHHHLCLPSSGRRHGESEPRSVSTPWSAHGMTLLVQVASSAKQLHTRLHCKLQDLASWSPDDTLCPKARGLSPQHAKERTPCVLAARPCFPCLLSAIGHRIICSCGSLHCALKCHRTCPGEICTSSWSQAVHHHLCLPSSGRRHGESEPRSVSTPWSAHGMTLLVQVASSAKQLHTRLHCKLQDLASWSPDDTLCPKARGLSPQHAKERTPCVLAARPCFPCLLSAIANSVAADLCVVH